MATYLRTSMLSVAAVCVALATGCGEPAVGDPCLPEQPPENGFNEREAYIETSSVQCETRVCLVFNLDGDPREGCVERTCAPEDPNCVPLTCASEQETEDRVYCSCRCDAPSDDFAECECPDGFSCTPVLREGGPGVRGSYCVKTATL